MSVQTDPRMDDFLRQQQERMQPDEGLIQWALRDAESFQKNREAIVARKGEDFYDRLVKVATAVGQKRLRQYGRTNTTLASNQDASPEGYAASFQQAAAEAKNPTVKARLLEEGKQLRDAMAAHKELREGFEESYGDPARAEAEFKARGDQFTDAAMKAVLSGLSFPSFFADFRRAGGKAGETGLALGMQALAEKRGGREIAQFEMGMPAMAAGQKLLRDVTKDPETAQSVAGKEELVVRFGQALSAYKTLARNLEQAATEYVQAHPGESYADGLEATQEVLRQAHGKLQGLADQLPKVKGGKVTMPAFTVPPPPQALSKNPIVRGGQELLGAAVRGPLTGPAVRALPEGLQENVEAVGGLLAPPGEQKRVLGVIPGSTSAAMQDLVTILGLAGMGGVSVAGAAARGASGLATRLGAGKALAGAAGGAAAGAAGTAELPVTVEQVVRGDVAGAAKNVGLGALGGGVIGAGVGAVQGARAAGKGRKAAALENEQIDLANARQDTEALRKARESLVPPKPVEPPAATKVDAKPPVPLGTTKGNKMVDALEPPAPAKVPQPKVKPPKATKALAPRESYESTGYRTDVDRELRRMGVDKASREEIMSNYATRHGSKRVRAGEGSTFKPTERYSRRDTQKILDDGYAILSGRTKATAPAPVAPEAAPVVSPSPRTIRVPERDLKEIAGITQNKKTQYPVLRGVLVEPSPRTGHVLLRATDLDRWVEVEAAGHVDRPMVVSMDDLRAGNLRSSFDAEEFPIWSPPRAASGSVAKPTSPAIRPPGAAPAKTPTTEPQIGEWMGGRIKEAASRRKWADLPPDFERSAVKAVFSEIKPHFGKADIRQRVNASKATTFKELEAAITPSSTTVPKSIGSASASELLSPVPVEGMGTPIQRVVAGLKGDKTLRALQEATYSVERGQRIGAAEAAWKGGKGEAGARAGMSKLAGEHTKVERESIRGKFTQEDLDYVYDQAKDSPVLSGFERATAIDGLDKLFGHTGSRLPTEKEIELLSRVFPEEFIEAVTGHRTSQWKKLAAEIVGIPRELMTTGDVGAVGRQGLPLVLSHPRTGAKAFGKAIRDMFSERHYRALPEQIVALPNYEHYRRMKIAIPVMQGLSKKISGREEKFATGLAQRLLRGESKLLGKLNLAKIPVAGRVFRAGGNIIHGSQRFHESFLSHIRVGVADKMLASAAASSKLALKQGRQYDMNKFYERSGRFVNAWSGRGNLGSFENAASDLATAAFAPRFYASHLQRLNPLEYIRMDPITRVEALRANFALAGFATTVLGMAEVYRRAHPELGDQIEAGWDWRSANFGKVRLGKTRIDVTGGHSQYLRTMAQVLGGQTVSSTTGRLRSTYDFGGQSEAEIIGRFGEGKMNPALGYGVKVARVLRAKFFDRPMPTDFEGRPISIKKETLNQFTQMIARDIAEVAKTDPQLLPITTVAALAGFSTGTYPTNTTRAMDSASRLIAKIENEQDKQRKLTPPGSKPKTTKLTRSQRDFKEAVSEYRKALREGTEEEIQKAKDKADRHARSIIGKEGWE